ncbi:MAG: hypothetical protein LC808_31955 [Actinobacteria bacterium]|nr:hypothetical protein [Actinomycetota bacterium]
MGHSHHAHGEIKVPARTQRIMLAVLSPFVIATVIGVALLWPGGKGDFEQSGSARQEFEASVVSVTPQECPDVTGQENFICSTVTVEIGEGEDAGETFTLNYSSGPRTRPAQEGDNVIVGSTQDAADETFRGGRGHSEVLLAGFRPTSLELFLVNISIFTGASLGASEGEP